MLNQPETFICAVHFHSLSVLLHRTPKRIPTQRGISAQSKKQYSILLRAAARDQSNLLYRTGACISDLPEEKEKCVRRTQFLRIRSAWFRARECQAKFSTASKEYKENSFSGNVIKQSVKSNVAKSSRSLRGGSFRAVLCAQQQLWNSALLPIEESRARRYIVDISVIAVSITTVRSTANL